MHHALEADIENDFTNNQSKLLADVKKIVAKKLEQGGQDFKTLHFVFSFLSNITVTDPEEWLCVARLPLGTDHDTFLDLLSEFGGVKESFLLVSSKTGE